MKAKKYRIEAMDFHDDSGWTMVRQCATMAEFEEYGKGAIDMAFRLVQNSDGAVVREVWK